MKKLLYIFISMLFLTCLHIDKNLDKDSPYESKWNYTREKPVVVKGYYRKDGTYVRPHTRSRPKKIR